MDPDQTWLTLQVFHVPCALEVLRLCAI